MFECKRRQLFKVLFILLSVAGKLRVILAAPATNINADNKSEESSSPNSRTNPDTVPLSFRNATDDGLIINDNNGIEGNNINNNVRLVERAAENQPNGEREIPSNFSSELEFMRAVRNRRRETDQEERVKDNWLQALKENILRQLGRSTNATTNSGELHQQHHEINDGAAVLPITFFWNHTTLDSTIIHQQPDPINDYHITEKIRSYYPSCGIPNNTDRDLWIDDTTYMNLYFNFDYNGGGDGTGANNAIAAATLRLYRNYNTSSSNTPKSRPITKPSQTATNDCDSNNSESCTHIDDDDDLYRVSLYWYTRQLKKRTKIRRRLADSQVISTAAPWVELSVQPAIRYWLLNAGRNFGLAVLVEDQEGNSVPAKQIYHAGLTCSMGASTPRPIPTIIIDAARRHTSIDNGLLGDSDDPIDLLMDSNNATVMAAAVLHMIPTLDICTVEVPSSAARILFGTGNQTDSTVMSSSSTAAATDAFSNHYYYNSQKYCNLQVNYLHPVKGTTSSTTAGEATPINQTGAEQAAIMRSNRHIRHEKHHIINSKGSGAVINDSKSPLNHTYYINR